MAKPALPQTPLESAWGANEPEIAAGCHRCRKAICGLSADEAQPASWRSFRAPTIVTPRPVGGTATNLEGDFIWHDHKNTDETFIVLEGVLRIDFRDGAVHLSAGEMFVVRKGVEHKPYAKREVKLLLIEPRGVLNTGHEGGERTAENDVWI